MIVLRHHGSRGQRVYFGVGRYDRILVGDVALEDLEAVMLTGLEPGATGLPR